MAIRYLTQGEIDYFEIPAVPKASLPSGDYDIIAGTDDETDNPMAFICNTNYSDMVMALEYEYVGSEEDADSISTSGWLSNPFDIVEEDWEFVNNAYGLEIFIGDGGDWDFYIGYIGNDAVALKMIVK